VNRKEREKKEADPNTIRNALHQTTTREEEEEEKRDPGIRDNPTRHALSIYT